jgi:hypothetical protein
MLMDDITSRRSVLGTNGFGLCRNGKCLPPALSGKVAHSRKRQPEPKQVDFMKGREEARDLAWMNIGLFGSMIGRGAPERSHSKRSVDTQDQW